MENAPIPANGSISIILTIHFPYFINHLFGGFINGVYSCEEKVPESL
jgi:hypothetical protein